MRKASVVLLTLSYFVLVNGRIARLLHGRPFVSEHVMPGIAMPAAQPGAAAWENALIFSLAFVGVVLALIPLRRGERWAGWKESTRQGPAVRECSNSFCNENLTKGGGP